jgi:hypothetical protein
MQRDRIVLVTGAVVVLVCAQVVPRAGAAAQKAAAAGKAGSTSAAGPVERGQYLLATTGCHDCHTPLKMGPRGPEPDMSRQLSGHPASLRLDVPPKLDGGWMWAGSGTNTAFAGPWGISYAINLTPDATGLGNWTEDMFVQALKTGKHAGAGRPILPPMPWHALSHMTDEDLRSIFAALRRVPPVANLVPPAVIAPPRASATPRP